MGVFDSVRPHRRQPTRLPGPWDSPGKNTGVDWPSSHLCHPLLLLPPIPSSIRVFSNVLALGIRWPKYWNFSISSSNEYSGLISFRIDWFDLLAVPADSQESSPEPEFEPFPSPGELPNPAVEPRSPTLQGDSLSVERGPGIALQVRQEKKALSSRGRGRLSQFGTSLLFHFCF